MLRQAKPWSRASPPVSFPYPSLPLIAVCLLSRETTGFRCDSAGMHIWLLVLSGHRGRRARRCRDSPAGARPAFPGCSPAVGKRPERPGRRWSRTRHTTGKTRAERSIPPRITWPWMCAATCQRRNMSNTPETPCECRRQRRIQRPTRHHHHPDELAPVR